MALLCVEYCNQIHNSTYSSSYYEEFCRTNYDYYNYLNNKNSLGEETELMCSSRLVSYHILP